MHKPPLKRCPYCGSSEGLYSTFTGMQMYDFRGNTKGFSEDAFGFSESDLLRCIKCGESVTKRSWLKEVRDA